MLQQIYSLLLCLFIGAWPLFGQSQLVQSPMLANNWLKYRGEPQPNCAVGTLTIQEEQQGKDWTWEVSWVEENLKTKVPWIELQSGVRDPYTTDVISIFGVKDNKLLVWGKKFKWGWVEFDPYTMQYVPGSKPDWKSMIPASADTYSALLQAPDDAGPLRKSPNDNSPAIFDLKNKPWRSYKEHREYGYYRVDSSWVLVLEQMGDWVRVRLPKSELKVSGTEEDTYTLKITWDSEHTGWIRWCRPGPVKGSKEILLSYVDFGFYD